MYKNIAANKRNTVFIMIGFVLLVAAIGALFAYAYRDWWIVAWVMGIAAAYAIFQYFAASKLAVAMTGAKKIEKKDITEYLKNYVYNSNPIIVVYVNPDVYEQTKAEFDNAGFVQITAENSFWWSK